MKGAGFSFRPHPEVGGVGLSFRAHPEDEGSRLVVQGPCWNLRGQVSVSVSIPRKEAADPNES